MNIIETIKELGFKNNVDGIDNEYQFIDDNYHIIIIIEYVEDSLTTEIVDYYYYYLMNLLNVNLNIFFHH